MATPPDAIRDLVIANRILAREGVVDEFGHISIRHPENPNHYLISRSLAPEQVTEHDLFRYTLTNELVEGDDRTPYAERAIHGGVYEARPDVMSVCHNHSPSIIPFGVTEVPLRPVFHMAGFLGHEVPVWDIADEFGDTDLLVRSVEQGRSLARALGPRRVALMRGHGSVVAGGNVREVVMSAVFMERNAQLQIQALQVGQGKVKYLRPGEVDRTIDNVGRALGQDRSWNAWRVRISTPAHWDLDGGTA